VPRPPHAPCATASSDVWALLDPKLPVFRSLERTGKAVGAQNTHAAPRRVRAANREFSRCEGTNGEAQWSRLEGFDAGTTSRSGATPMRQLVYALRFSGEAKRIGIDGNVLKTAAGAPGCTVSSRIAVEGLSGTLRPAFGGEATFESELVFTGATTFQQTRTIEFGRGGHRFRFSIVGSGHLGAGPESDRRHGAAIWRIEGGEGEVAGASGLIASIIVVSDTGEFTDHHLGVVFVP
jgi:hypothetical protein